MGFNATPPTQTCVNELMDSENQTNKIRKNLHGFRVLLREVMFLSFWRPIPFFTLDDVLCLVLPFTVFWLQRGSRSACERFGEKKVLLGQKGRGSLDRHSADFGGGGQDSESKCLRYSISFVLLLSAMKICAMREEKSVSEQQTFCSHRRTEDRSLDR